MSEIRSDESDLPFLSRRLKAAHEIAEVEAWRSDAHEANSEATKTLARFDMLGEWSAANEYEQSLFGSMATLLNRGYNSLHRIDRTDAGAKIAITIPAGLTKEDGYVALRRRRRFMNLTSMTEPPLDVDKISMFALDINMLARFSEDAAREVRLIVAGTMYLAIDHRALERNDFGIRPEDRVRFEKISAAVGQTQEAFLKAFERKKLFDDASEKYGITVDEIVKRFLGESPHESTMLCDPESILFIEQALQHRSELLTPAATTYYVHAQL